MNVEELLSRLQDHILHAKQSDQSIKALQAKLSMLNKCLEGMPHGEAEPGKVRKPRRENDLLTDNELLARLKSLIADRKELTCDKAFAGRQVMIRSVAEMLNVTQLRLKQMLAHLGPTMSLNSLICRCRVEIACTIMADYPNYTIETIAQESGFQNRMTFYRWFHSVMGCTPKTYMDLLGSMQQSGN